MFKKIEPMWLLFATVALIGIVTICILASKETVIEKEIHHDEFKEVLHLYVDVDTIFTVDLVTNDTTKFEVWFHPNQYPGAAPDSIYYRWWPND